VFPGSKTAGALH